MSFSSGLQCLTPIYEMSSGNVERFIRQYAKSVSEKCLEIPEKVYPHMFRKDEIFGARDHMKSKEEKFLKRKGYY